MDIFSQEDINTIKRIFGFISIVANIILLFAGIRTFIYFPYDQIHIYFVSVHSGTLIIWTIFNLTYLIRYFRWQFLLAMVPIYELSDIIWNVESSFINKCQLLETLLRPQWQQYEITMLSLTVFSIFMLKLYDRKPLLSYRSISLFIIFSIAYISLGVPVITNICSGLFISSNWTWEAIWQIVVLLTFGDILNRNREKTSFKMLYRWYFGR